MLQTFRKLSNTWVIKAILIFLVGSFIAWGIAGYLSGYRGQDAFTINGNGVSIVQIDRAYNNILSQIQAQYGIQLTKEQLFQQNVPQQVFVTELQQRILLNTAEDLNITAPKKMLALQIQRMVGQNMSKNAYRSALQSIGYSVAGFEAEQADTVTKQAISDIFLPPTLPSVVVKELARLENLTFDADIASINLQDVSIPQPSTEELTAFYTSTQNNYLTPENRTVDTITLSTNQLMDTITISKEAAQTYYQENQNKFTIAEQRNVRSLTAQSQDEIQTIQTRLTNGEDFSAVAADFNGQDLGSLKKDDIFAAAADAVFALDLNTPSTAVETPLGYQIFQVTQITPAKTQSFKDVKDKIETDLKRTEAEETYYTLLENLEDAVAGRQNLADMAAQLGLTLKTQTFTSNKMGNEPQVHTTVFQTPQNTPSGPLELDTPQELRSMFYTVTNITPAQPKPFEEVKSQVRSAYMANARRKALQERLAQAQPLLKQGKTLQAALKEVNLPITLKTYTNLKRREANQVSAFTTEKRDVLLREGLNGTITAQTESGALVAKLKNVKNPELSEDEIQQEKLALMERTVNEIIGSYIAHQVNTSNISYNMPLLRAVFGANFTEETVKRLLNQS